ncbi:MAG: dephospho-CoA kinase [Deinococcus sp.]
MPQQPGDEDRAIRRLGLTGSIGAGKSTAARLLRARGLTVLDADEAARELGRDPGVLAEVGSALGAEYLREGQLDRPRLAALVFADPASRQRLNGILHPRVRARMAELEREAAGRGERWVVQDVPLLFEGDGWRQMDATLVIDAPLELRQRRVQERSGLPAADFVARDAAQLPAREKRALASAVIDNDGSEEELDRALGRVLEELGVLPLGGPAA